METYFRSSKQAQRLKEQRKKNHDQADIERSDKAMDKREKDHAGKPSKPYVPWHKKRKGHRGDPKSWNRHRGERYRGPAAFQNHREPHIAGGLMSKILYINRVYVQYLRHYIKQVLCSRELPQCGWPLNWQVDELSTCLVSQRKAA